AANFAVALLLRSHSSGSLAVKGAYMEVVADTVGSLGVLIAGVVTVTTHWPFADVVVAVLVALWVLPRAIALARDALRILSESSPTHIDVEELRAALGAVDGVTGVHDLHVWTLSPGKDMCTAHLISTGDPAQVLHDPRAATRHRPDRLPRRHRLFGKLLKRYSPSALRAAGSQSSSRSRHRAYSSVSPIVSAASASAATQRRKPRLGSCEYGTGPKPFQPFLRSWSRPR